MPSRRSMTPADLRRVVVVEELDLSSDGRLAVVARRSIQGDRLLGHLFALRLDGRSCRGRRRSPARPSSGADRRYAT
ncbi:MAG: hypothetical protein H0U37_01610 [Chloroflexi bacterium]|nr:hypothetical protein [Chloroflexota bacterium]